MQSTEIQKIKARFSIIGNSAGLDRSLSIAMQVSPTDLSVLITGESGTGKEIFPQIIHQLSHRKHGQYIAVNCGAIPEGTIDSELFGHEKGSFTGAHEARKGYFEVADKGTIFLDEVAELPLSTQVRLLRVLETGEFMKVGSSKSQKTNVRVAAATNVNMHEAIQDGRFREDLYYRLNTVPISIPPLRERRSDIYLLFRKFSQDFAEKYRMPSVTLDEQAQTLLQSYRWPGNIRQLKNIVEQISIIEQQRNINVEILKGYLPDFGLEKLPAIYSKHQEDKSFSSEREILYKILFDMRNDLNEMKKVVREIMNGGKKEPKGAEDSLALFGQYYQSKEISVEQTTPQVFHYQDLERKEEDNIQDTEEFVEASLSLSDNEAELIKKALDKHMGKRKNAAHELGISERTLYRKLKEYNLQ